MKNLLSYKGAIAIIGCMLFINSTSNAHNGNDEKKNKFALELHLLKNYLEPFTPVEEEKTFKFYDADDNLVFETTVKQNSCLDVRLVKMLNESDFLTEVRDQKLHRLKKS